jgi:hypothetical protein
MRILFVGMVCVMMIMRQRRGQIWAMPERGHFIIARYMAGILIKNK